MVCPATTLVDSPGTTGVAGGNLAWEIEAGIQRGVKHKYMYADYIRPRRKEICQVGRSSDNLDRWIEKM